MPFFLKGALVEYSSEVFGPIPNIVVFQFNPEQIARTLNLPSDVAEASAPTEARETEPNQASAAPVETFSITAHFSAAVDYGEGAAQSVLPRLFGVGPQLSALEKMVYPKVGLLGQLLGADVDAVASAVTEGDEDAETPVPRIETPKILFIWGPTRILPVRIRSMSITEQKYDPFLNPVQAQVEIGLAIATYPENEEVDDDIGKGALKYTETVKDVEALLNLAKAAEGALEIISF